MPFGQHIAHCFCCGTSWICGDCIPPVCPDCSRHGHTGHWDCPVCEKIREHRSTAIKAAVEAERRQKAAEIAEQEAKRLEEEKWAFDASGI